TAARTSSTSDSTKTMPRGKTSREENMDTGAPIAGAREHNARAGGATWSGARLCAARRSYCVSSVERHQSDHYSPLLVNEYSEVPTDGQLKLLRVPHARGKG